MGHRQAHCHPEVPLVDGFAARSEAPVSFALDAKILVLQRRSGRDETGELQSNPRREMPALVMHRCRSSPDHVAVERDQLGSVVQHLVSTEAVYSMEGLSS
jgi:hypothetical protein